MGYVPAWNRQSFKKTDKKEPVKLADGKDPFEKATVAFKEGEKVDVNSPAYWSMADENGNESAAGKYWRERAEKHNAALNAKIDTPPTPKRVEPPVNKVDADDRDIGERANTRQAEIDKDVASLADIGVKKVETPRPAAPASRRRVEQAGPPRPVEQAGPPRPVEQAGPPRPVEQAGPPRPQNTARPTQNASGPTYSGAYPVTDVASKAGSWFRRNLGTQAQREAQKQEDEKKR